MEIGKNAFIGIFISFMVVAPSKSSIQPYFNLGKVGMIAPSPFPEWINRSLVRVSANQGRIHYLILVESQLLDWQKKVVIGQWVQLSQDKLTPILDSNLIHAMKDYESAGENYYLQYDFEVPLESYSLCQEIFQ